MPRPRLTYANVVSTLCLLLLVGAGTAHAAGVAANSVGSLQIRNGAVARVDLHANAVDSAKVVPDSLTGADVREGTLRGVNAAKVGGLTLAQVDRNLPADTGDTVVHRLPGLFRLVASCSQINVPTVRVVAERGDLVVQTSSTRAVLADDNDGSTDLLSARNVLAQGASVTLSTFTGSGGTVRGHVFGVSGVQAEFTLLATPLTIDSALRCAFRGTVISG